MLQANKRYERITVPRHTDVQCVRNKNAVPLPAKYGSHGVKIGRKGWERDETGQCGLGSAGTLKARMIA